MGLRRCRSSGIRPQIGHGDLRAYQTWLCPRCSHRIWSVPMTKRNMSDGVAYTPAEMMIVTAARALADVRTVFVGVGLPNIACNLARSTVAPALELIYESGVYGAQPARLPLS